MTFCSCEMFWKYEFLSPCNVYVVYFLDTIGINVECQCGITENLTVMAAGNLILQTGRWWMTFSFVEDAVKIGVTLMWYNEGICEKFEQYAYSVPLYSISSVPNTLNGQNGSLEKCFNSKISVARAAHTFCCFFLFVVFKLSGKNIHPNPISLQLF